MVRSTAHDGCVAAVRFRRIESPCIHRSTDLFPKPFHRRWREHHERTGSAADQHEPMGYSAWNRHERSLSSRRDFAADVEAAGAFQYVERLYRVMMMCSG